MKLSDVKAKIDAYFEQISGEEIVSQFEEQGCVFELNPIVLPFLPSAYAVPPTLDGAVAWQEFSASTRHVRVAIDNRLEVVSVKQVETTVDQFISPPDSTGNYSYTMSA